MLKKRQQSHPSIIRGDESNEESLGSSRRMPKRHRTLDIIEPSLPPASDRNSAHFTRLRQTVRSQSFARPLAQNANHSVASLRQQSSRSRSIPPSTSYAGSQISDKSQSQIERASLRSSVSRRPLGDDNDDDDFQETQNQGTQAAPRALRELSSNNLNRRKHRSTRKLKSKKLEGSDFDILPDKCYQDLRKILQSSYNQALNNLDDSGAPRGHNSSTVVGLGNFMKSANKKLKRLLIPPSTPHQLFDLEYLKEKEAKAKQALAGEIADYAQMEVSTLNAERAIDLKSEEYDVLQGQIQKEEADHLKKREELKNRHALLDQDPQGNSYIWNLLRFPSSSFSQGENNPQKLH